jgi:hypothetical protein
MGYFAEHDLLTANKRPRRGALLAHFAPRMAEIIQEETSHEFL